MGHASSDLSDEQIPIEFVSAITAITGGKLYQGKGPSSYTKG